MITDKKLTIYCYIQNYYIMTASVDDIGASSPKNVYAISDLVPVSATESSDWLEILHIKHQGLYYLGRENQMHKSD